MDISKFVGHTPGPWCYEGKYDVHSKWTEQFNVNDLTGEMVMGGCGCCNSPWASNEANAALIAAAPELLAEVIRLRSIIASLKEPK